MPSLVQQLRLLSILLGGSLAAQVASLKPLENALRGHVSFLAADALAGRDTPSPGLDVAAEYIASRFRMAGLKPLEGDSYFQETQVGLRQYTAEGFTVNWTGLDQPPDGGRLSAGQDLSLKNAPLRCLAPGNLPETLKGKVAVVRSLLRPGALAGLEPALVVVALDAPAPEDPRWVVDPAAAEARLSVLRVVSPALRARCDAETKEDLPMTLSLTASATPSRLETVRNVGAILPGRGPRTVASQFVLVSAHYDHVGVLRSGPGDRINNGANDDASGVAALLEVAQALARQPVKPRRSVLFLAFFGEELGFFGSRYYVRHPVVPLASIATQLNLEQLGRTDATEGNAKGKMWLTGYGLSDAGPKLNAVAQPLGLAVRRHPEYDEDFFRRSDNLPFAEAGIPAHTLGVAFGFPDYHRPGDEWQKLDYPNFARVTSFITSAIRELGNAPAQPQWNKSNKGALEYQQRDQRQNTQK